MRTDWEYYWLVGGIRCRSLTNISCRGHRAIVKKIIGGEAPVIDNPKPYPRGYSGNEGRLQPSVKQPGVFSSMSEAVSQGLFTDKGGWSGRLTVRHQQEFTRFN
ncbi:unnamed protein product [Pleuronectes platessa]|uniref:Uncharacterized protein n=1 Tax=Pleuronectes platessa TaxID=8262 RepID=A0A9N7VES2_PLEPL|nr:unnamed protein product [Pleuronectes platessa]